MRAAAGLQPTDVVAGWSNDSSAAFVAGVPQVPARPERVNLQTGVRAFIRELAPPDRAGVSVIVPSSIIDDGRGYAYFYIRAVATWYVVTTLVSAAEPSYRLAAHPISLRSVCRYCGTVVLGSSAASCSRTT